MALHRVAKRIDPVRAPEPEKVIYVFGAHKLQNEVLAICLGREMGTRCLIAEDVSQIASAESGRDGSLTRLVLLDCVRRKPKEILRDLKCCQKDMLSQCLLVLFNLADGFGIEEECLAAGARGFFYEKDSLERLLKGLQVVLQGEVWVSRRVLAECFFRSRNKGIFSEKQRAGLTPREAEILAALSGGQSNDAIADKLCISTYTVKTHFYNIFKKIDVDNRLQAALWAARHL